MRDALIALGVAVGGVIFARQLRKKGAPPAPPGGPVLVAVGQPNIT